MRPIKTALLAILPTLTYGFTTPGIENVPAAPLIFPDEDNRVDSEDAFSPTIHEFHESSTEDTLTEISEPTNKETYPRPALSWLAHLPRPELGSVPYGEVLTSCSKPNTIALTFDDGPWKYTSDLLDLLESAGARATFFVCGSNMDSDGQLTRHGYPSLIRRMVTEGHQVGSHTWGHADLTALDEEDITSQVLDNEQALVQDLGFIPTYLRPPYFSYNEEVLDVVGGLGYHVVDAGVDTLDWEGDYDAARDNFDEAIRKDKSHEKGMIVLAHDIKKRTVHELAEYMIEQADEHGYRLVTLGECLGDPPRNWYRSPSTGESWLSRIHGFSSGSGSGHGHVRGRGHDSDLEERAVVPPPDAPKEEEASNIIATPTPRHRLHIHSLPPPTEHHRTLIQRAEEAINSTYTEVSSRPLFDPCPNISFKDFGPRWEWCCDRGYDFCPWRIAEIAQEAAKATPYTMMEVEHQPILTPAASSTTAAVPDMSIITMTLGHVCKKPHENCTPIYKTVTRIIDYVDGDAATQAPSVHTIILGHLCKRNYVECSPVTKKVTRIADHVDGNPTGTTTHRPEGLAAVARAMPKPTTASDFPFGKLPPIGSNMPPDGTKARVIEVEEATEKMDKRSTAASSDSVNEFTVVLVNDLGDSSEVLVDDMYGHSLEVRHHVDGGQDHNEQQHQEEKEQEQETEHCSTANATTADVEVPITAGAVRASTTRWGLVVVVANLQFWFW